ncbi:MAG: aminodeoxychorismate/anthranilate synthase component II [Crocinitomicaceae bacterium]|nr:aminodeoxychorismate/anthranilate synthase component II [Crocinitomicaceae bacterium]
MQKITVIDNYDSFVFNLVRYFEELNCEVSVQRNDRIDYSELENSDGILLSPGPGIPTEAGQLMEVIDRFAESKKMLGVCLGHQAIAQHFGGEISQSMKAIHGKQSSIEIDPTSTLFHSLEPNIDVGRYHSWHVEQLPDSMRSTAQLSTGQIMAIEHSNFPIYGVQFHPESILTPQGRTIISNWLNALK